VSKVLRTALPLCAMLFFSAGASAAAFSTYVKSTGADSNTTSNCSQTAPCRSLRAALAVTASWGEVVVLDSADYGPAPVKITRSVSITAPDGVDAGLAVSSGDGIDISGFDIAVSLRGLRINGANGGANGINFLEGGALRVKRCAIYNLSNNGIQVTAANVSVFINDVEVRQNGQSGILLSSLQTAILDGVRAESNGYGVYAAGGANVEIRNSSAAFNYYSGGFNLDASTADTTMTVSKSSSLRNAYGVTMYVVSPFHGYLTVEGSEIDGNSAGGITDMALKASTGGGTLTVTDSKITRNVTGIYYSDNGANTPKYGVVAHNVLDQNSACGVCLGGTNTLLTLEANVVTGSTYGVAFSTPPTATGPVAYSRGDNTLSGNSTNVFGGSVTPLGGL
jgi:hypothetical protein